MLIYDLEQICELMRTDTEACRIFVNGENTRTASSGEVKLTLKLPYLLCADKVRINLFYDADGACRDISLEYTARHGIGDIYECSLSLVPGLYYFTFEISTPYGKLFIGNSGDEATPSIYAFSPEKHQLLIYDDSEPAPDFSNCTVYQIFVDRFYKKGAARLTNGSILNDDWDNGIPEYAEYPGQELKNNTFFGGNLDGVIDKLSYLQKLGINTIYLCPIFQASSNHKYDTGDYEKVDPAFGSTPSLKHLIKYAHSLGIKIILDGVFNHTGDDSKYFNKYGNYPSKGAYNSKRSKYYNWYTFNDYPNDYKCWWGVKILPTLDTSNDGVIDYFCSDNGIIKKYLRMGIDGWRLDVVDELDEQFLLKLNRAAKQESPNSIIIGEVWEDASNKTAYSSRRHYFQGKQLDSVMNYPLRNYIIDFVNGGDARAFVREYTIQLLHYPKHVLLNLLNFLGTHDTVRIITELAGEKCFDCPGSVLAHKRLSAEQRERGKSLVSFAFAVMISCPGMPCIFYGDEVGLEGYRDPFNRMPFPWKNGDFEFSEVFSRLLKLRQSNKPLCKGSCEVFAPSDHVLAIKREYENEVICSVFNSSTESTTVELSKNAVSLISGISGNAFELSAYGYEMIKFTKEDNK